MSTQPITPSQNFDQFMAQQTAAAAPQSFDQFMTKQAAAPPPTEKPGAVERLATNFLSGVGVTSNEQAKNFFKHPLDSVIKSLEAQGELAKKAKQAYDRGDYMEALQHSLNYMVPFVGQQTDQAGDQLKAGDVAGGIGRTLGAAVPIVAGSPEVQAGAKSVAASAAETGARAVRAGVRGANAALEKAPGTIGGTVGAAAGGYFGGHVGAEVGGAAGALAGKELLPTVKIPGEGFGLPSRVVGGPKTILPDVEPPAVTAAPAAGPAAVPAATSTDTAAAPAARTLSDLSGENIPRTLNGESVLREELTKQPNPILLKIAKSRGVDVAQESLLKPSNAVNNRIINKIVEDFSPDELENTRSMRIQKELHGRHDFGDIGKEANETISLQTYFPELKIPLAQTLRTQKAIAAAGAQKFAPLRNLSGDLVSSVTPDALSPEGQKYAEMLKQVKAGKKLKDLSASQ